MIQEIKAPITIYSVYDHKTNKAIPFRLRWDGNDYKINSINLHYTFRQGRTLYHIFSVDTHVLSFKLSLNTDNLFWTVEQISDGQPE